MFFFFNETGTQYKIIKINKLFGKDVRSNASLVLLIFPNNTFESKPNINITNTFIQYIQKSLTFNQLITYCIFKTRSIISDNLPKHILYINYKYINCLLNWNSFLVKKNSTNIKCKSN